MDDLAPEDSRQIQETNKMRRFGFAGLCFGVAIVCFFIQKGDAALNPSPSWIVGLLWYSAATALIVAGIWLWNRTANRHWILRTILSVAAIAVMALMTYNPVANQYSREHPGPIARSATPQGPPVLKSSPPSPSALVHTQQPALKARTKKETTTTLLPVTPVTTSPTISPSASQPGSINQANSGVGINIQQATTGGNSPIINSPITVGDIPKQISVHDKTELTAFFRSANKKATISMTTDQMSGSAPFPDDFYDAMKDGGWTMAEQGVNHMIAVYGAGRIFQGAVIEIKGEPLGAGERASIGPDDPVFYIGKALELLHVNTSLNRNQGQTDGVIKVSFMGGFPKQ